MFVIYGDLYMSENLIGDECPFKPVLCSYKCASAQVRTRTDEKDEEEDYMICIVLAAIGVDAV